VLSISIKKHIRFDLYEMLIKEKGKTVPVIGRGGP
jgi:hypothetical protein